MAASTISVDEDQFCCPVCLDVLRDPVTIPCGHSYCMECIKGYWRKTEHKVGYSCPQCRRCFTPRPALARNTMLEELVDKLRQVEVAERQQQLHPERLKAPRQRERTPGGCPQHRRPLELYCRTEQLLICGLCAADAHSGHTAVTAAEERRDKQWQLEESLKRSKQKSKEKEKELKNVMRYLKRSAQAVEEDSERICTKLIRSIDRRHCDVRETVRAEERAALAQAEAVLERLEQQTEDHRRRESELQQLSNTDDHIHFLQKCKSLSSPFNAEELPDVDVHPYFSLLILRKALTDIRERVNDVCDRELSRISGLIQDESAGLSAEPNPHAPVHAEIVSSSKSVDQAQSEPKTRADLLQYCCEVTLDPNTANSNFCLSEGNRRISAVSESQHYLDHPDRFATWAQVLAREAVSGRGYWEVEWSGTGEIALGVCYRSLTKHWGSSDGKMGSNSKSWSLNLSNGLCTFQHNNIKIEIPTPLSSRIGVFLDQKVGTLAFYCISPRGDTMTQLHRVQTTFSQPLYPGFWVGHGSTLRICPIFNFSA